MQLVLRCEEVRFYVASAWRKEARLGGGGGRMIGCECRTFGANVWNRVPVLHP